MGHKALSKMQLGRETTAGTAVAATAIWRGPFAGLKDERETTIVPENIGIALPSNRSYSASLMGSLSVPVTEFTPQQGLHVFEAGIKTATAAADGDSSGYLYRYAFGTTSLNTIKTYSWQTGDETQAELLEYAFVKSFTITATPKQALNISSEWAGRQVQDGSFTGSLSPETISHIHSSNGSLWIDDNDGSFGGTAVAAGNLMEVTLNVTTGQKALFTVDSGQLYFQGLYFDSDEFDAELEMKWLGSSAGVAERANWKSNTPRLIRIDFTGEAYSTPGSSGEFTQNALRIDFPGSYTNFSALEHEEGKSIFTATVKGGYDTVSGDVLELWVANEKSSL